MVDPALATAVRFADGCLRARRWLVALCCFCCALAAAPVWAADPADGTELRKAEAAATEAKVFFKAGLFDKASTKFMEAFAISKRPSLMYNAARAYEEGLNFREAVALLRHYRDLPDVGVDGKRDADERIARMEGVLRQQAADEAQKAEVARLEAERVATELRNKREAERARQERERLEREREERERVAQLPLGATPTVAQPVARHVSWVLVASAAAVGVLSGGAYGEALYEANQARKLTIVDVNDVTTYQGHVSDAKTFQAVAITGTVVASGLAAWALLDWWFSGANGDEKTPPKSSIGVFPAPGGGMLSWGGSF